MRVSKLQIILFTLVFGSSILVQREAFGQDVLKILPLGNSITVGYTDGVLPESNQISYRFGLYYQLINAGHNVDFVGSELTGWAYFSDCQHAGINGFRDQYMVRLLQDGYDMKRYIQLVNPPGPYLDVYDPDIILLHIGTNDITHETNPGTANVEAVLNLIDDYEVRSGKQVPVFLALIVNRMYGYNLRTETTNYNNQIRAMAEARIQNGDNIIIVDMENDAGLEYTTADMTDYLHPNSTGYNKMATLWFNSINTYLNQPPEITPPIPDQEMSQGGTFNPINLDNHVIDNETPVEDITWSMESPPEHFDVIIDQNRIATISPKIDTWEGSETLIFKAEDAGVNGLNKRFDLDDVVFTVIPSNDPPEFISDPITSVQEGSLYLYIAEADYIDIEDLTYSGKVVPDWLTFDPDTRVLSGIADNGDLGEHQVILAVTTSDELEDEQEFFINVENINDVPVIVGMAKSIKTSINIPVEIELTDLLVDDPDNVYPDDFSLHIEPGTNYAINGNHVIPDLNFLGTLIVPTKVNDGIDFSSSSNINVQVVMATGLERDENKYIKVYPNPTSGLVNIASAGKGDVQIRFINSRGVTMFEKIYPNPSTAISVDLDAIGIPAGIYIFQVIQDNKFETGKLFVE
jgi:lysophospholipase L1-like esterase